MLHVHLLPTHPDYGKMQEHVGCLVFVAGEKVKPARREMLRLLEQHRLLFVKELHWQLSYVSPRPTGNEVSDEMQQHVKNFGFALHTWMKPVETRAN